MAYERDERDWLLVWNSPASSVEVIRLAAERVERMLQMTTETKGDAS